MQTQELFTNYVNSINAIIAANQNEPVIGNMMKLSNKALGNKKIAFGIVAEGKSEPHDFFTGHFGGGKLLIDEHGKSNDTAFTVKLSESHMEKVVKDKEKYEKNPLALDWDWLKSKLVS